MYESGNPRVEGNDSLTGHIISTIIEIKDKVKNIGTNLLKPVIYATNIVASDDMTCVIVLTSYLCYIH